MGKFNIKHNKRLLIIIVSILAALLVIAVGVVVWLNSLLNNINRIDPEETNQSIQLETLPGQATDETDPVIPQADKILASKNVINILLVGQDRRENQEERMHSDSMILCTINTTKKTITMTSFMRDVWVYVPGYHNTRLNVPYMHGGFKMLNDTLEYNFGVRADYNVEIDFSGFMKAVDLIGGVEIELTEAEAKYLNKRGNWDIEENCNWDLKKGVNTLSGSQALAYSRIRKIDSDFKRTNRQRKVLTALIEKTGNLGISELLPIVKEVLPLLATDMSNSQIIGLIMDILPMLSNMEIVSQRIPMDKQYSYANKYGASVIVMSPENIEENKKLLIEAMSEE